MERAAQTLTPVSLELGGKDPMIVLADADLERAANAAAYYSMQNGGQTCISVERVYVEAPVYDEFVAQGHREGRARCARARRPGPGTRRRRRDHVPAAARHRRAPRRATRATRAPACSTGGHARDGRRALLRADRARRRRPLDGVHDRGDVRADAADHEGRRRRGGDPAGQRLALRARRVGVDARTSRAARRSRAGSRPARCASTTRSSTTSRSSCRWAAGRSPGLGSRHGAGGIRKYTPPAGAPGHALRAQARPAHVPVQGRARPSCSAAAVKLLYGRGKRD